MSIDLSKYKKIINKVKELGFDNFYQAGTISQYHELNLIIEDKINDIQYWISKSFGEFRINYRQGINNSKAEQHIIKCGKTQKYVIENFEKLVLEH
jgi:hypothetical protein